VPLVVRTCNDFVPVCNLVGAASFNVCRPILVSCQRRAEIQSRPWDAAAANSVLLVVRTCNDFVSVCNLVGAASFNVYHPTLASCQQRAGI
jgi:hypothetical protein